MCYNVIAEDHMSSIVNKSIFNNSIQQIRKKKLLYNSWFLLMMVQVNKIEFKYVPMARRGNKPYAWRQYHRLEDIQNKINSKVIIKNDCSNLALITLTLNPKGLSELESWQKMKVERPKFSRIINRKLKPIYHMTKIEAHKSGYCHCHILLVLPDTKKCFHDRKGKLRNIELTNFIKQYWVHGNSDLVLASDKKLTEYVTKEMGKYAQIEDAIKRADKQQETDNDVKAIYTHYYADKLKMRLVNVSKSLAVGIDVEEEDSLCLDYYKTSSTKHIEIFDIPPRIMAEILSYKPPPYTIMSFSDGDTQKILNYIKTQNKFEIKAGMMCKL